jgi:hypothetical protein
MIKTNAQDLKHMKIRLTNNRIGCFQNVTRFMNRYILYVVVQIKTHFNNKY